MDAESGSLTAQGNLSFLAPFYNEDSKASLPKEISDPQTLGDGAKSLSLPHTRFYSNTRRHPHHRLVRIAGSRGRKHGSRQGTAGGCQGGAVGSKQAQGKACRSSIQNATRVPKQSTGYRLPEAVSGNYRYRGPRADLFHFPERSEHVIHILSLRLARC